MAHGPAQRPLETTKGNTVDSEELGDRKALATSDRTLLSVAEEQLLVSYKILRALEILIEEEMTDEI